MIGSDAFRNTDAGSAEVSIKITQGTVITGIGAVKAGETHQVKRSVAQLLFGQNQAVPAEPQKKRGRPPKNG